MIFLGCSEAAMIFLGCLKISWTDPPVCVSAECPPGAAKSILSLTECAKELVQGLIFRSNITGEPEKSSHL